MKKTFILAALTMVSVLAVAQTQKREMAKTENAVVFLNGAELTQKATLTLQKGENEVLVEGLSPFIDRNSLKVRLSGGVVVSSFEYSIDYLSADKSNNQTQLLEDSLTVYKKQLSATEQELQTNKSMLELLRKGVDNSLISSDKQTVTSEQIEKNLTYYQTRASRLLAEQTQITQRKSALENRIAALQKQIRQDAGQKKNRSGILTLSLNSPKAGKAQAEIVYFTPRAVWTPLYDLTVTEPGKPIDINMKAQVSQTTGLDWNSVRLTLSTGTPSRSNQVPTLGTWYVSRRTNYYNSNKAAGKARVAYVERAAPMMEPMMGVAADGALADIEEEEAAIEDYVTAADQALSVDYAIDLPYTILGNGKQQTIGLRRLQATDVTYKYMAVPKLDGSMYLTAEINNYGELSLLNGTANLTVGNTYFGQTYIDASTTDKALRLTLGDDPQLNVKREKVTQMSKTKTSGKEVSQTVAYKITVRNNKKQAVKISLQEPYPISTAKEITVELSDKTTTAAHNDTERGILTYEAEIAPAQSKEFIVSYTVKYPKDWDINW